MDGSHIKTLRGQVEHILETIPETRNDDIRLTLEIWKAFYPGFIKRDENNYSIIRLADIWEMPREDNVKRVRAQIQNEERRFLPTSPEVLKKRGMLTEEWRKALGYTPKDETNL